MSTSSVNCKPDFHRHTEFKAVPPFPKPVGVIIASSLRYSQKRNGTPGWWLGWSGVRMGHLSHGLHSATS